MADSTANTGSNSETFAVMQQFMLEKGLIKNTMNEKELLDYINNESMTAEANSKEQPKRRKTIEVDPSR